MKTRSRQRPRAALAAAAVLAVVWFGNELGVALGLVPGRPLPWLWLVAPLAVVALKGLEPPTSAARAVAWTRRFPGWALAVGLGAVVVCLWFLGQHADPYFGHDEAVYATKARDIAGKAPASLWELYRPPLLPVLGAPIAAAGGGVAAFRLLALILAIAALGVLAWVAEGRTHPGRASVTVLLFIAGFAFQRRLPEFLNDLAAAGLLLAVAELLLRSRRPQRAHLLPVAAALVVIAFYLRYGALTGVLAVAAGAVAAFGFRTWTRPGRPAITAVAIVVLGLLPHFLWATSRTGSPWGVLTSAESVAGRSYVGQGLVEYAASFPWLYAGDIGGLVMAFGLVMGALALRRRRTGSVAEADQRVIMLSVLAVTQVLLVGVTSHGEERFVFLSIMALLAAGVQEIARRSDAWSRPALLAAALAALVTLPATARWTHDARFVPATDERRSIASAAAHVLRTPGCLVVTGYEPEMGWDTRCATTVRLSAVATALRNGDVVTIVRFAHGRYQASPGALARALAGHHWERVTVPSDGSLGASTLFIIRP